MTTPHYVIRGGLEGRERLRVLSRVMGPTTNALLDRIGIAPDARCLDLGCGGGDVTALLAARVPDGVVTGVDVDETQLDLARAEAAEAGLGNVEFLVGDATGELSGEERFDLVYARFLLSHLPDPGSALEHMCARLAPNGALVVEDVDFRGHFTDPASPSFSSFVDLYTRVAQARGCDPNIGPRLPSLLREAGLVELGMHVVQPAGFEGEVKLMGAITLEAIADAVVGAGLATHVELEQLVDEMYVFAQTDGTVASVPRIVQAWGRTPPP